jgi:small subunit ribosomal protein S17e
MGNIKSAYIKKAARGILETFPDKFTTDYKQNSLVLRELVDVESKSLRNKIAGYITNLVGIEKEGEKSAS